MNIMHLGGLLTTQYLLHQEKTNIMFPGPSFTEFFDPLETCSSQFYVKKHDGI